MTSQWICARGGLSFVLAMFRGVWPFLETNRQSWGLGARIRCITWCCLGLGLVWLTRRCPGIGVLILLSLLLSIVVATEEVQQRYACVLESPLLPMLAMFHGPHFELTAFDKTFIHSTDLELPRRVMARRRPMGKAPVQPDWYFKLQHLSRSIFLSSLPFLTHRLSLS